MKQTQRTLLLFLLFSTIARAANWETSLDADLEADVPAPTLDPFVPNIYPYFSPGTIPVQRGLSRSKDTSPKHFGRLDYRQTQCSDPTYILACPITDHLPCCPPDFPICCRDPSDKCCATGSFCVGILTCCPNGSTGCGEGCCQAGTTCCNAAHCCDTTAGYLCQGGQCVNPILSSLSAQSVASVLSVQSIQSLSIELSGQTRADGSDTNTINTVNVSPNDPRIEYDPPSAWTDVTSNSGVGSCNNGTKAANSPGSNFTFTFSGSAISLFIVPSANGGPFTVQVDAEAASNRSSKSVGAVNQCIPSQVFTRDNMQDKPHLIIVKNGATVAGATGGTLEFNGITYTGKGAFGTGGSSGNSKVSPAVIGGSVGGALGAIVLVGAGVLFWLYRRKRRNGENGASAPVTPNLPMMYQQQPPGTDQTPGSPQHPPSAYGGMVTGPTSPHPSTWSGQQQQQGQYPTSPQQQQYALPQQQQYTGSSQPSWAAQQQQQQAYNDYHRPVSGVSAAGLAPLPMWVERANSKGGPSDAVSMTSAEHSAQPSASQH